VENGFPTGGEQAETDGRSSRVHRSENKIDRLPITFHPEVWSAVRPDGKRCVSTGRAPGESLSRPWITRMRWDRHLRQLEPIGRRTPRSQFLLEESDSVGWRFIRNETLSHQ